MAAKRPAQSLDGFEAASDSARKSVKLTETKSAWSGKWKASNGKTEFSEITQEVEIDTSKESDITKRSATTQNVIHILEAEDRKNNRLRIAHETAEKELESMKSDLETARKRAAGKDGRNKEHVMRLKKTEDKVVSQGRELETERQKFAKLEKSKIRERGRKIKKMKKVVAAAKKVASSSGHVGWQTYLKLTDKLKNAIAVLAAEEDEYEDGNECLECAACEDGELCETCAADEECEACAELEEGETCEYCAEEECEDCAESGVTCDDCAREDGGDNDDEEEEEEEE